MALKDAENRKSDSVVMIGSFDTKAENFAYWAGIRRRISCGLDRKTSQGENCGEYFGA
ncbi:hypothetical protein SAMN05421636_102192 [Pricia antarctica]|uniref:Uncharacterized protein n=1 Tax=Pricia antarctica TaxID=641691 RepID=A0A1G6YBU5_9FLAO|nr:hypothetical protein SAMN05421636_102192 [Pricia antarctica]